MGEQSAAKNMIPDNVTSRDYWRGIVDTKLQQHTEALERLFNELKQVEDTSRVISEDVKVIKEKVSRLEAPVVVSSSQRQNNEPKNSMRVNGEAVTWQWVRERLGVPVLLGAITLFLFTVMPAVFVLIILLPRILGLLFPDTSLAP